MKERPIGFLANYMIPHDTEEFDYIIELHEYLWRFVRAQIPSANGNLRDFIDDAVVLAEQKQSIDRSVK